VDLRRCIVLSGGVVITSIFPFSLSITFLSVCLVGCSDQVQLPSAEQVAEFQNAHPTRQGGAGVLKAKISRGLSRVRGERNTDNE